MSHVTGTAAGSLHQPTLSMTHPVSNACLHGKQQAQAYIYSSFEHMRHGLPSPLLEQYHGVVSIQTHLLQVCLMQGTETCSVVQYVVMLVSLTLVDCAAACLMGDQHNPNTATREEQ